VKMSDARRRGRKTEAKAADAAAPAAPAEPVVPAAAPIAPAAPAAAPIPPPAPAAEPAAAVRRRFQEQELRVLVFELGGHEYVVPVSLVQEIVRPTGVMSVPSAAPYVRGVMKRRGRLVPIVDLGLRLGIGSRPETPRTCAVLVRLPAGLAGLVVDATRELLWVRTRDFAVPSRILADEHMAYLMGMAHLGDRFLTMLDVHALFSPVEQQRLELLARAPGTDA
jgi:purine-binding chemotaxis protein CheW